MSTPQQGKTPKKKTAGNAAPAAKRNSPRPWRRLWQIPLLCVGLATFATGVWALTKAIRPVPFETHVHDLQNMLADGQYSQAIGRINKLAGYFQQPRQVGTLEKLAGDATYLAQSKEPAPVRLNYQHVQDYYARAVANGIPETGPMDERWGEAALQTGDAQTAIHKWESAIVADPTGSVLRRHVRNLVAAYLAVGETPKAQHIVDQLLADAAKAKPGSPTSSTSPSVDDRAWGLCEKIKMALAAGPGSAPAVDAAVTAAEKALTEMPERDPAGHVLTWIGRAEVQRGNLDAAEKHLTQARKEFLVPRLDDGRAAILLARIAETKGDLDKARALFQEVVTSQQGTPIWAAARLGRAEVTARRAALQNGGSQAISPDEWATMNTDYAFAIAQVTGTDQPAVIGDDRGTPEMISKDAIRASIVADYDRAAAAGQTADALSFLTLKTKLGDPDNAVDAVRRAAMEERRAGELVAAADAAHTAGNVSAEQAGRDAAHHMLALAAADYRKESTLTTMQTDVSGNSLWKAAQLYDAAGEAEKSIAAYREFIGGWPGDSRIPEGLLAVGRLEESIGDLDAAIAAYQKDIKDNPKTPAAYRATVNLARCYMGQGPQHFAQAEAALLSLVQDNSDLLPTAEEFRISLFTLGELYFRNGRWADAILRLEEAVERYPNDPSVGSATFMLAESYRHSAADIAAAIQQNPRIDHRVSLEQARTHRLQRASELFTTAIDRLDPLASPDSGHPAASPAGKLSPLDHEYLRACYMDRAGCAYALGNYPLAIKLYDQTSSRFSNDVTAVEAYVQIVNAYLALKEPTQASAAAERAQWVLKRVPDAAFSKQPIKLTRQYYQNLLQLGKGGSP